MGAMMAGLDFDRYCSEIVAQTKLLTAAIDGDDMTVEVPSCPGWNVGQLVRHLGGAQRWAADMVRTAAAEPLPDKHFRELSAYSDEDAAALARWLLDSAMTLADALCGSSSTNGDHRATAQWRCSAKRPCSTSGWTG
jgi:uncharacterized protein (TIGR03083 family)